MTKAHHWTRGSKQTCWSWISPKTLSEFHTNVFCRNSNTLEFEALHIAGLHPICLIEPRVWLKKEVHPIECLYSVVYLRDRYLGPCSSFCSSMTFRIRSLQTQDSLLMIALCIGKSKESQTVKHFKKTSIC